MAVDSTRLFIDGPTGRLEAMLELPTDAGSDVFPAIAVICHPHPQFQGTMLNKVVHTLSRTATDCGMPALRFNYRGVGKSEGEYDDGHGETDDAQAAAQYLTSRYPDTPLVLMGFSFGSGVALRLAQRQPPVALITAAPPVGRLGVPEKFTAEFPWQVIQGTSDELVDAQLVSDWVSSQKNPPELVLMEGVSHFFHGSLTRLRTDARSFVTQALGLESY